MKKIELKPLQVDMANCGWGETVWSYMFSSEEYFNPKKMDFYVEHEEAENMGEFRKLHNISSKELLEWLNENYK